MRTVLFVHGTGTREPAYSLMLERIRTSLAGRATVERCYWGETEGAKLHAAGASIPQYQSTRAATEGDRGTELLSEAATAFRHALEVWADSQKCGNLTRCQSSMTVIETIKGNAGLELAVLRTMFYLQHRRSFFDKSGLKYVRGR